MSARARSTWQVHRPVAAPDGAGGQTVVMQHVGDVRGDVRELAGVELVEARQAGAEHTHTCWFGRRAGIARNDELRSGARRLLVLTVSGTFPPTRLRVTARTVEAGG